MNFINVSNKTVEFEDGQSIHVSAFRISEYCVTIGEFLEFEKATGYLSVAEKNSGKLFYLNELIEHVPMKNRQGATAFCMSYVDACHYCEWAKVRLPTEAEWMAAAIIDERIYDRDAPELFPFRDADGEFDINMISGYPKGDLFEYTTTQTTCGCIVTRGGPWYFRESDWREGVDLNRRVFRPDEWALMNCFRVVAIDK